MKNKQLNFQKIKAPEGLILGDYSTDLQFNEYRPKSDRVITIGQLFVGSMGAFVLMLFYFFFGILEG